MQPSNSGLSVSSAGYTVQAQLENVLQANQVSMTLNGNLITNVKLINGVLTAPVTLTNGVNTIVIYLYLYFGMTIVNYIFIFNN